MHKFSGHVPRLPLRVIKWLARLSGAEIIDETTVECYVDCSLQEAKRLAPFPILIPDYSQALSLKSVMYMRGADGLQINIDYSESDRTLWLIESGAGRRPHFSETNGEIIDLLGTRGLIDHWPNGLSLVKWMKGRTHIIMGTNLDRHEFTKVAESLGPVPAD